MLQVLLFNLIKSKIINPNQKPEILLVILNLLRIICKYLVILITLELKYKILSHQ
jgi:hypothetical protein